MSGSFCTVDGCKGIKFKQGYCAQHLNQFRAGTTPVAEPAPASSPVAAFKRPTPAAASAGSFTEALDAASLEAFSIAAKKPFSEQAQFFLNAFWDEFNDQCDVIYYVLWEWIKKADMKWRGCHYIHLYDEGNDLDFDSGLYLFEQICKYFTEDKKGLDYAKRFPNAVPEMKTSVVRKKELRDRVDVNFDGRISFLEFLLYQYNASPKDLMVRSAGKTLPEEVLAAMRALEEVNKRVREYETEKARLESESQLNEGKGIKALAAKNLLAQLNSSPLWEQLNKALITAEAAVRIASRKYGVGGTEAGKGGSSSRTAGTVWWLNKEIEEKKKKYGKA